MDTDWVFYEAILIDARVQAFVKVTRSRKRSERNRIA
jgi:hypothetical protein